MYDSELLEKLYSTRSFLEANLRDLDNKIFTYIFKTLFDNYPDAVVEWVRENTPEKFYASYLGDVAKQEYFPELHKVLNENSTTLVRMFGESHDFLLDLKHFKHWKELF